MTEQEIAKPDEITCSECRDMLSDFLDQELETSMNTSMKHHLESCTKCGSESTEIKSLKNVVQHWDGLKRSGEWRQGVIDTYIRESQMMPSQQFKDAAKSAREAAQLDPDNPPPSLPAGMVLAIATMLAVAAYFLIQHFFV